MTYIQAFMNNFLGKSPNWYKLTIVGFLLINPVVFWINPFVAGWLLVVEFIFTLAMALKCYPLQPGGLLAIEAVTIGMTTTEHVKAEVMANFEVILLLMFMVAGIYFMKQLLLYVFTKLLLRIHSKIILSIAFCLSAAFLSAFLDALTVIAVIISVGMGFYGVYHKVASGLSFEEPSDISNDHKIKHNNNKTLEEFRAFLRSLLMHAAIGTALGGVMTLVGEPQNLIIAEQAGWGFKEFFLRMTPVTVPTLICGVLTCVVVEKFHLFGYGAKLPRKVWSILARFNRNQEMKMSKQERVKLLVQVFVGIWLIIGLAMHLAAVGLIGLSVIILTTAYCGINSEHELGKAFQESLPFTALLVVFFSIVAVIIDQNLFAPIIAYVLSATESMQLVLFYTFNGVLSAISDNVFVATVYINEAKQALINQSVSPQQFELLAVAINTGTNLPSVATPNGQAAFLFLLTSSLAPLIRLSYGRMVYMALPYTIVLSIVGLLAVECFLPGMTQWLINSGLVEQSPIPMNVINGH